MNRARFLGLFLDETRQHLAQARSTLGSFETHPQSPDVLSALMRHCHSMKGMAATMGFEPFVELAHRMEGLLRELEDRPRMWSEELAPLFAEGLDHLGAWSEQVGEGRLPEHTVATRTLVERLDSLLNEKLRSEAAPLDQTGEETELPAHWSIGLSLQVSSASPTHRILSTLKRIGRFGRVLRVRPPQLPLEDVPAAMNLEFELSSTRTRQILEHRLGQLAWVTQVSLDPIVRRKTVKPRIELPSEWTRVPAESLDWIADNLRELALRNTLRRDTEGGADDDHGGYLINRVYDRVAELRLVPLMSLGHRLEPAVRDAARRDGKQVRFALSGGEVGVERSLLDRLVEPLRHLVRNAVAHGIETPAEREVAGKPVEGLIRLTVARHRDRLHLELTDDGRGMNAAALRRAAVDAGELDAAEADSLPEKASLQLAFLSAVTTRDTADRLAGRGAGLDLVAREFRELGSTLDVVSARGEGTRFTFELPMRRAVVQSLVFSRDGQTFAIPLQVIRRATSGGTPPLGAEVLDLAAGNTRAPENAFYLELDRDEGQTALVLIADEVVGRRDLWLQPLARAFSESTYVNGAAIVDDGTLALMIDPDKLAAPEPIRA